MFKRLAVVLSLTLVLSVCLNSRQNNVFSSMLTEADVLVLNETTADEPQEVETKKSGNGFVKVVTFPFKAIGRIFGGGKKDDNKLHRLSKKDVKKFESMPMTRVVDARTTTVSTSRTEADLTTTEANDPSLGARELKQKAAQERLQHGRELLNSNDVNGAINSLSMAASMDPELWDAHNLVGIAYEMKGLRGKALESLEAALKGKQDKPEHLNDFGYILMKNGEYSRAAKYLKRAVKAQPNDQRFLNNLGMAQVQLGKFDEAYKNFERAMGEFDGRMNMATRLVRMGHDKEAIKHLEHCRAIRPTSLDILYPLSVLYARNGKTTEAEEANKTIVSIKATATTTPK